MSSAEINMVAPKFRITLSAQQTLEVGRLSVIWGQIDHFTFHSVSLLLTRDIAAGRSLLGKMTTGPLINTLNKSRHRIADDEIRELTKTYCAAMNPLIEKRNHIMHGIWGAYLPGKNPNDAKPGCLYLKDPSNPAFPDSVTDLANKAAEQTHSISKILHHLAGWPYPEGQPTYFFGPHEPRPPEGTTLVSVAQPPAGYRPPE